MYMGGSDKRVSLHVWINLNQLPIMKYSFFSQLIAVSTAKVYHPVIRSGGPSDKISIINLILTLKSWGPIHLINNAWPPVVDVYVDCCQMLHPPPAPPSYTNMVYSGSKKNQDVRQTPGLKHSPWKTNGWRYGELGKGEPIQDCQRQDCGFMGCWKDTGSPHDASPIWPQHKIVWKSSQRTR